MVDRSKLLAESRSVLLVDWPRRDVPDYFARAGLTVVSREGDDLYYGYAVDGDEVVRRPADAPEQVDLVYSYRPIDELPGIVDEARRLGARTVWYQSNQPDDIERAKSIVEGAGLEFVSEPE